MICAIHQPQTYPYLGFFAKMIQSDCFVYLDNVQFKKNEWQNRNRIKTPNGWQWLTVPVIHNFGQKIKEVKINNTVKWREKHLQALQTNYGKAPYFKKYLPTLLKIYEKEWNLLVDFNLATLEWLKTALNISTPTYLSSDLLPEGNEPMSPEERLILICKKLGADVYLSGEGGHNYLNQELFPQQGIQVTFLKFSHPTYNQLYGDFIPYLSTIDLLFNMGDESLSIIKQGIL